MDQLVPSNGRPINVNEYPLSLKPIANDIRRVTQRRPAGLSLPASQVPIEIPRSIEITITSRENEISTDSSRTTPTKTLSSLRSDGRPPLIGLPIIRISISHLYRRDRRRVRVSTEGEDKGCGYVPL